MNLDLIAKSPIISVSGYVIGIIAFVFSIYTYQVAKQSGQIYYTSDSKMIYSPVETRIPPESILKDKFFGKGRIYISQFSVWNGGNLAFEPQVQRTPVVLSGDSNVSIFDIKITTTKTLINENFVAVKSGENAYAVNWKVFDPDDGFKIQVLHSGSPQSLSIGGKFAPNYKMERWVPAGYILPGFLLLSSLIIVVHVTLYYSKIKPILDRYNPWFSEPAKFLYAMAGIVMGLSISFGLFYSIVSYSGGISPFGLGFDGKGGIDADTP